MNIRITHPRERFKNYDPSETRVTLLDVTLLDVTAEEAFKLCATVLNTLNEELAKDKMQELKTKEREGIRTVEGYKLIFDNSYHNLAEKVEKALQDGWAPQGGAGISTESPGRVNLVQAMVRKSE